MPDLQQGLNKQSVPSFDLNRVPINRGKMMKEADLPTLEQPNYFKRFELTEDGISPRTIPGSFPIILLLFILKVPLGTY